MLFSQTKSSCVQPAFFQAGSVFLLLLDVIPAVVIMMSAVAPWMVGDFTSKNLGIFFRLQQKVQQKNRKGFKLKQFLHSLKLKLNPKLVRCLRKQRLSANMLVPDFWGRWIECRHLPRPCHLESAWIGRDRKGSVIPGDQWNLTTSTFHFLVYYWHTMESTESTVEHRLFVGWYLNLESQRYLM